MIRDFKSAVNDDGQYAIWETKSKLGYWADPNKGQYTMGPNHQKVLTGWIYSGGYEEDTTCLCYFDHGKIGNGLRMMSTSEQLEIIQTSKAKGVHGYGITIYPDGSWLVRHYDKTDESKGIYYDADKKKIYMVLVSDGEFTESKELDTEDADVDFTVPFSQFSTPIAEDDYFTGKFELDEDEENKFLPELDGPYMEWIDENECMIIASLYNMGYVKGTAYYDWDDQIALKHWEDGCNSEEYPDLTVWKESKDFKYSYYEDSGEKLKLTISSLKKDGCILIHNYAYEEENLFDCIQIDEDFNVDVFEQYDVDKEESYNEINYNFDEVMNGESEDEDDDSEYEEEEESDEEDDDSEYEDEEESDEEDEDSEYEDEEIEDDEEDVKPVLRIKKKGGGNKKKGGGNKKKTSDIDVSDLLKDFFKKKNKK